MSPSKRERDYARRRYEEYQKRQAERAALKAKRRKQGIAAGIAAAAVLVVVGLVWFLAIRGSGSATPAANATASSQPSASPSSSASAASACPPSTAKPVSKPEQWSKAPSQAAAKGKTYTVTLHTNCGDVVLSLDGAKAPKAVASTVFLAKNGFYSNTPCHRLTTQGIFVLQCGDPTATGNGGPGYHYGPVENAPRDNVYPAGTIAMARAGGDGNSNGSQFFLVYKDSTIPSDGAGGYTVLGKITKGLDVVEKVAAGGAKGTTGDGAPTTPISITSVTVTPSS